MEGLIFLLVLFILYIIVMPILLLFRFNSHLGRINEELSRIRQQMGETPQTQEMPFASKAQQEEYEQTESTKAESVLRVGNIIVEEYPEEELQVKPTPIEKYERHQPRSVEKEEVKSIEMESEIIEETDEESISEEIRKVMPPIPRKPKRKINYEKFIGENLFGKIGILVFVIGVGLFVKYAIDQNWINETLRTVMGFFIGSALLATAGRLQKTYRTFSSLLAGGAFGIFYLTVAIAFHYYHLFSQTAAFLILIAITLLMPILAILYDRRELAIISLVGGFLAPFIVSNGGDNYLILFTYLSILNIGMFCLSIYKKWSELPILSFAFTYLILFLYVANHPAGSITPTMAGILLLFCVLFFFIFLLPIFSILHSASKKTSLVLLSVVVANNFAFLGLGLTLLNLMKLEIHMEGLLSLFIAITNLSLIIWLRKHRQDYQFLTYAMLGLVLTFVSITVPLQLSGNYITLFWASEMVLLLWLYIKSRIWVYEYATLALIVLTFISFMMDLTAPLPGNLRVVENIFINGRFATSLFMGLTTGAFAYLTARFCTSFDEAKVLRSSLWNTLMSVLATIIIYFTFMREFSLHLSSAPCTEMMVLFTSISILIVCYAFKKRFPLSQYNLLYKSLTALNILIYMCTISAYYSDYTYVAHPWLGWLNAAVVTANLYDLSRRHYQAYGVKSGYTIYLNVLATFLWLSIVQLFLVQTELVTDDFTAAFSISMSIAGFVQMSLGMRLHQKVLRVISLFTFGIVLAKLILIDLWAMPTLGKIIVFIILGLILLILSFLYQKLKNVLFKDDENEEN